jgi:hypothetical protein
MTTGDEPALGGQGSDNSPMISSVQTRVIVSARGAYTVGNLNALIDAMSDEQKIEFKISVITTAYESVEATILQAPPPDPEYPILYNLARQIGVWIRDLKHASLPAIDGSLAAISSRPHQWDEHRLYTIISAIAAVLADLSADTVSSVSFLIPPPDTAVPSHILSVVKRQWYLDLAWSILAGLEHPAAPIVNENGIQFLSGDLRKMYQQGDIVVLMYKMTSNQLDRFRTIILTALLRQLEQLTFPDAWRRLVHVWLTEFGWWVIDAEQPTRGQYYSLTAAISGFKSGDDYRLRAVAVAGQGFLLLTTAEVLRFENSFGMESVSMAMGYAAAASVASDPSEVADRVTRTVKRWHLETAWAILHDEPLPPLATNP